MTRRNSINYYANLKFHY